jgi:uncharacterized protein YjeT (DUF2065 family)
MQDLLAAMCLVLVFEGLLPFVNPQAWRRAARVLADLDDRTLRVIGAVSIVIGLVLLQIIRSYASGR